MNNEPVAWMRTNKQWRKEVSFVEKEGFDIPLYTHPVKEHFEDEPQAEELHKILQSNAELTDEEILISAQYNGIRNGEISDEYVIDFARAILRKAQEK